MEEEAEYLTAGARRVRQLVSKHDKFWGGKNDLFAEAAWYGRKIDRSARLNLLHTSSAVGQTMHRYINAVFSISTTCEGLAGPRDGELNSGE